MNTAILQLDTMEFMGPGFRRDDSGVGSAKAEARLPLAGFFASAPANAAGKCFAAQLFLDEHFLDGRPLSGAVRFQSL